MSKLPKQNFFLNSVAVFLALPLVFISIIYVWSWSQSSFRCISWTRPIIFLFNSQEQYVSCKTFSDLGNASVSITNKDLNTVIDLMSKAKSGTKISKEEAAKYALGRAKIEKYAELNNIFVSEKEIDAEVDKETKELGSEIMFLYNKTMAERRMEIRGFLLQTKVESSLIKYIDAEWVALRWDVRLDELWKPEVTSLKTTAQKALTAARVSFQSGATAEQALKAAETSGVDLSKLGFNLGDRQKLFIDGQTAQPYKSAVGAEIGVTDIFCDNRFCAVFKIYKTNNGAYDSFDDFLGELKGW